MNEETVQFEEGKTCPIKIEGTGGGLSFTPSGDMLLIGTFQNPSQEQIEAWSGKWRAKLAEESDFPSIPIFAVGSDNWIIEAPCNPRLQETESPGFCEALYSKGNYEMVAILVNAETGIILKITRVPLDETFIERLVLSWNPFKRASSEKITTLSDEEFGNRVTKIFQSRSSKELWKSSW